MQMDESKSKFHKKVKEIAKEVPPSIWGKDLSSHIVNREQGGQESVGKFSSRVIY